MIGEFLGKDKDISHRTNYAFFSLFPFQNLVMDVAMRGIFKKIRLPKESQ
jgi:Sec7-like guanine-nucleotide exchange factor